MKLIYISILFIMTIQSSVTSYGQNMHSKPSKQSSKKQMTIDSVFTQDRETIICNWPIVQMPEYKNGGDSGMQVFLRKNLNPLLDTGVHKIVVNFTVGKNGRVSKCKVVEGQNSSFNSKVIMLFSMMEFIPGRTDGKLEEYNLRLPIILE
jgi:hypothetical protein